MTHEKPPRTVAEDYMSALHACGVSHVFANGGTDFAPIIEGLVQMKARGEPAPEFVTVPHENVATAMAQGYWKVAGKPAAVMVHVNVGTANTICALMNAARDNVPMLLAAGRTPLTETGHAGSRDVPIHWAQEQFDQASIVRENVKWDYELRHGQPINTIVARALDIAMSEPKGPVYLQLPREALGDDGVNPGPAIRSFPAGAAAAAPSLAALEPVSSIPSLSATEPGQVIQRLAPDGESFACAAIMLPLPVLRPSSRSVQAGAPPGAAMPWPHRNARGWRP